jgi:hypothetical protein
MRPTGWAILATRNIPGKIPPMAHKKPNLPTKICPVCGRPFAWRKKWARCWDSIIYCSERCRRNKHQDNG